MSIDHTVHVGPFVECLNGNANKEKTRRSCTNPLCPNHENEYWNEKTKFCDLCGQPIDKVKYEAAGRKVDADMLLADEQLSPMVHPRNKDIDLWFGNRHRANKDSVRSFSFDPERDGEQYVEVTPEMMAAETTEFIDQYRDAISKLRAAYGLENVTIKWGVVHDIH